MPKRRSRAFRSIFVAAPGRLLMAADYSQVELRAASEIIYAAIGQSRLRDGFMTGLDAHRTTALALTGKNDPDAVTDGERDQAKAPNFGLIYGMRQRGFFYYVRDQYSPTSPRTKRSTSMKHSMKPTQSWASGITAREVMPAGWLRRNRARSALVLEVASP